MRAVKKAFPKPISFLKIKLYDTDMIYEHDIIERFQKSIFKTFEVLFEAQEEHSKEVENLEQELKDQKKRMDTLSELLNTDNSLDRINAFFEQLSTMMLSKNFSAKVDQKAMTWLRNLFGDKFYNKFSERVSSGKKKRTKSRRKNLENKHAVYNEILEVVNAILESSQNSTFDGHHSKLEFIKNRLNNELLKDSNKSIKSPRERSFFTEVPKSPGTVKNQTYVDIDDNTSMRSETTYSEFGADTRFGNLFDKFVSDKAKEKPQDYDYLSMMKLQAQVIENMSDLQKHSEETEAPMALDVEHYSKSPKSPESDYGVTPAPEAPPTPIPLPEEKPSL